MDALDAGGCPDIMAFPRQILFSCGDCSSYVRRHGSRLIVLAAWHLWSLEWVGKHHSVHWPWQDAGHRLSLRCHWLRAK